MVKRLHLLGYVSLFFLILGGTLLQTVLPLIAVPPLDESRKLSEVTNPWPRVLALDPTLAPEVNAWFDDIFGTRGLLVRLRNEIDYRLFGYSSKVDLGGDGYLFAKEFTQKLKQSDTTSHDNAMNLRNAVLGLKHELEKRGVKLMIVGFPSKNDVIHDYLPPRVYSTQPGGELERFRHFLADEPGIIFIDAREIMMRFYRENPDLPPYYRTDLHVNYFGSVIVAREILAWLEAQEGNDTGPGRKFTVVEMPFAMGIESRYLGLLKPPVEVIRSPQDSVDLFKDTEFGTWEKDEYFTNFTAIASSMPPFDFSYHTRPRFRTGLLPPTVIYGNSFSDGFFAYGMHEHFQDLWRSRLQPGRQKLVLDNFPPGVKYFILQYYEPLILNILP